MMKKRAFSMIELIFSIVIIALVFTVIPKIIFAFNKSDMFTIREDALFNDISLINMISKLPWDENNTNSNDILLTDSINTKLKCSPSTYRRVGGFIGSRECTQQLSASAISSDGESDIAYFNDFDDYNDINISAKIGANNIYTLSNRVFYINDDSSIISYDYNSFSSTIYLNKSSKSSQSTNLKELNSDIFYSGKRGKVRKISQFSYVSANIGQTIIKKRNW